MAEQLGDVINRIRRERRLTLRQLVEKVRKEDGQSISPQYLNDIELNRRIPSYNRSPHPNLGSLLRQQQVHRSESERQQHRGSSRNGCPDRNCEFPRSRLHPKTLCCS